ncbi:MAG: cupin domain-containing protein [Bacteroidales bacterium]
MSSGKEKAKSTICSASNIFEHSHNINSPEETFETLLQNHGCKVERIVSSGHTTPIDAPYVQAHHEWVMVLQGHAILEVEDKTIPLHKGDYLLIPAQHKHRVIFSSKEPECIWLAIHMQP